MVTEWQPISTAKKNRNKCILIVSPTGNISIGGYGTYLEDYGMRFKTKWAFINCFEDWEDRRPLPSTYMWMDLPKPPADIS